jgi:hypothetical protein
MNREQWLTKLASEHLWPRIREAGGHLPKKWRVSLGFPKGSRGGKSGHSVGQCWSHRTSADGHYEIFISPELTVDVATHILLHELIHASAGTECGHGGPFKKLAKAVGLVGAMRATVPGEALKLDMATWLEAMPAYPHAPLTASRAAGKGPGSRLLKVYCPECGYTVRVTRQWLDIGAPTCPNGECSEHGRAMVEG